MIKELKILIIEGNHEEAVLLKDLLEKSILEISSILVVQTLKQAITEIQNIEFDVIFLDLELPDCTGTNSLTEIARYTEKIAVIVFSGVDDKEIGFKAIQKGAQDYLVRGLLNRNMLSRIVKYSIERKQAEKMIKDSAQKWESTFNSITDILAVISKNYEIMEINQAGCEAIGMDKADILGKKCYKLFHGLNSPIEGCPCIRVLETKKMEISELSEAGRSYIYTAWPITEVNGEVTTFSISKKNITERKKAEEKLKESENRYRSFVDNFHGIAFRSWMNWTPIYFHGAVKEITGFSEEEFIDGNPRWDQIINKEDFEKLMNPKLQRGIHQKGYDTEREYRIITKDGKTKWVHDHIKTVYDNISNKNILQGAIYDITERKLAEVSLQDSKNKLLATFTAMTDIIIVYDSDGYYREIAPTNPSNLYLPSRDMLGKTVTEIFPPEKADFFLQTIRQTLKTKHVIRVKYNLHIGEENVWFSALVSPLTDNTVVWVARDITANIQAEEALRKREKMYRLLADNSVDLIWQMDLRLNFTYISPNVKEMLGFTQDECVGTNLSKYASRKEFFKIARQAVKGIKSYKSFKQVTFQANLIRKNGEEFPVEIIGRVLFNNNGFPKALHGSTRDITERKKSEEALQENEERYRSLVEKAGIAILIDDINGNFTYFNKRFSELFGYSSQELKEKSIEILVHPDDIERVMMYHNNRLENKKTTSRYEFKGIKKNGSTIYLEVDVLALKKEESIIGTRSYIWDITKRKEAEKDLAVSENKYRGLFEDSTEFLFTLDLKGNFTDVNKTAVILTGHTREELLKRNFKDYIPKADHRKLFHTFNKAYNTGEPIRDLFIEAYMKNNSTRHFVVGLSLLKKGDEIIGYQGTSRDITERIKAEEMLTKTLSLQRATLESTAEGILVVDLQGKIVDYNKKFIEIWNIAESIIPEGKTKDLVAPENAEFAMKHIIGQLAEPQKFISIVQELYAKPDAVSFDILHFTDGRIIERFSKPQYIKDDPVGRVWSFRDITERMKTEEELIKLSTAVNQSPSVIAITDIKGKLEYINPKFTELTGYTLDEVKGLNPRILKSGELLDEAYKEMWEAISSGKEWRGEFHNKKKSGEYFWEGATISPILDKSGKIINFLKVAKDITEQKQAEKIQKTLFNISNALTSVQTLNELLAEIRLLLSAILDTQNFYIALYENETDMLSLPFNIDEKDDFDTFPAGKTITKYVIDTGKPLFATKEVVNDLIKKGIIETVGSPSEIWVGVPLKIVNQVIGVIAVQSYDDPKLYTEKDLELLTFVSEEIALAINHKRSEEQIKRNLDEKNTLLKELYHRTKNNMQVISSMLRIQSQKSDDEFVHESFKEIVHKIQAMALVHQKLYQAEDLSNINLKEYIEEILESLMQSYNIRTELFSYDLDLKNVFVTIDSATPLGLVLNELISNVFKHSFPDNRKGKLTISLEQAESGDINIQLSDNGVGFPPGFNPEKTESMGIHTVYSLIIYQLKGSLNYEVKDGLSWFIKFSDTKNKQRI